MHYKSDMDEGVVGDYFMGRGRWADPKIEKKEKMIDDANQVERLEIFNPDKMPEQAYDLWVRMMKAGGGFKKFSKPGESPKIAFSRFLAKKRDEYTKKRKMFTDKYGRDYRTLDQSASRYSFEPVWRDPSKI